MILLYDDKRNTITAYQKAGEWDAANNADSSSKGPFPEGVFPFDRKAALFGEDGLDDGPFGKYFIAFRVPCRSGMAIHAGRDDPHRTDGAGRKGFRHATRGCIRMATEGIAELWKMVIKDTPRFLIVDRGEKRLNYPSCELADNAATDRSGSLR
jgi:hypothetical protein